MRIPDFDAFISYSHAADGQLAPKLQAAVEAYAAPWYRRRVLRIFRDETNLSITPGLWPMIEENLGRSRFFILMASPDAARSKWVKKEVNHWLTTKKFRPAAPAPCYVGCRSFSLPNSYPPPVIDGIRRDLRLPVTK